MLLEKIKSWTTLMREKNPLTIFTQLIVKNYFLWVTCNHPTFYNEDPIVNYKIAFSSLPLKPLSSNHIWISFFHTITIFCIVMLMPINLFISFFMSFRILLHPIILITLSNVILTSFLGPGIKYKVTRKALHIVLRGIVPSPCNFPLHKS